MWERSPLLTFFVGLNALLLLGYVAHLMYLQEYTQGFSENLLLLSYGVNGMMAFSITVALFMVRKSMATSLGFIFMGSSFFKFAVFFFVFYPRYQMDGQITPEEFGSFFIPYAICLAFETFFLVKVLTKD